VNALPHLCLLPHHEPNGGKDVKRGKRKGHPALPPDALWFEFL